MQQFSRKSFILAIFILWLTNVCKLQNNSRQLFFSEYVNEGDQLLARYQYKEAKYKYLLALHQITSKHKEYSKLKLKIWEINHNLFIYNNDSIFFNEILNAELKTNEDIIQAYCLKAMGHLLNQEYEMAKTYLDKVDKISSKLQNSTYYLTLAKYYAYKSNMPESTKACFKALNDAVKRNDNLQISNIYSKLSRNYLHESLYDESIKYARKSIQIQKNSNLINNLGQNYEVAMYYFYLDSTMQDSVLYYAKESLNYAKLSNDLNTQIYQYLNLATLFAPINKNKALEYLNELNNLKSEYSIPLHILSNIDLYLGVFEMENGNYEKAIEIFTNLKDRFADQSRSEEHLCFEYLSKCYLLTGKLDKALEMEKMRCSTKENYESARSRKDLLESELKYELLQKDRIILKDKLTILEKELNAKKYTQLYNKANFENILLNQKQTQADAINQNLKNQITINNQRSKLKINEKELTILRKNNAINTTIAISVSVLALISLIFLKLIWDKSRSLKNLETLFAQASQNLTNAKKHLEVLDSNSKPFISSSIKNQIEAISSDFSTFEMEINRIVDDTKNFKFQVHHEIKEPILQIQTLLARLTNSTNITNNEKETLSLTHFMQWKSKYKRKAIYLWVFIKMMNALKTCMS